MYNLEENFMEILITILIFYIYYIKILKIHLMENAIVQIVQLNVLNIKIKKKNHLKIRWFLITFPLQHLFLLSLKNSL